MEISPLFGIYGAGGCGRGVMPLARLIPSLAGTRLVFVDDGINATEVNGHMVMRFDDFANASANNKSVSIAIAEPALRLKLANKVKAAGLLIRDIYAPDVIIMDDVSLGEGAIISNGVIFTSNIRVGVGFHANLKSYIEHDCVIGDFVTLAPGAKVNGNVTIGDCAYIGSGAMIRQGVTIGTAAIIGMGAVVTHDVPAGTIVVGNPARPLMKD